MTPSGWALLLQPSDRALLLSALNRRVFLVCFYFLLVPAHAVTLTSLPHYLAGTVPESKLQDEGPDLRDLNRKCQLDPSKASWISHRGQLGALSGLPSFVQGLSTVASQAFGMRVLLVCPVNSSEVFSGPLNGFRSTQDEHAQSWKGMLQSPCPLLDLQAEPDLLGIFAS